MKVIDLLNKIVNSEEVPKKIKYKEHTYFKDNDGDIDYYVEKDRPYNLFLEAIYDTNDLSDEVEILDEEDEFIDIEEIDVALLGQCDNWLRCPTSEVIKQDIELNPYVIDNVRENTLGFQHKINDLIKNQKKIINKLKEEGK